MSKFKVGDIVRGIEGSKYSYISDITKGEIIEINIYGAYLVNVLSHKDKNYIFSKQWATENLLELFESKTEFTFQEVIARIKVGDKYECINEDIFSDILTIESLGFGLCINSISHASVIPNNALFKLVEEKKKVDLVAVEHKRNGKRYLFIADGILSVGDRVVCDTKYGHTYGKVVECFNKELTEKERKNYKVCWEDTDEGFDYK